MMAKTTILSLIVWGVLHIFPLGAKAQIYSWEDANGVKHYSNRMPPDGVTVLSETTELSTDESVPAEAPTTNPAAAQAAQSPEEDSQSSAEPAPEAVAEASDVGDRPSEDRPGGKKPNALGGIVRAGQTEDQQARNQRMEDHLKQMDRYERR
jgi:hypothetical protein